MKDKKAYALKLSSMSDAWQGNPPKKSGKHYSREQGKRNKKYRKTAL
jgi:hypothetical protein